MAYIDKNDNATTVRELQEMLRGCGLRMGENTLIVPVNGIFNAQTKSAVAFFQKSIGLPPTGIVDHETWSALVLAYSDANRKIVGIVPIARNTTGLFPGEHSCAVTMLQLMLRDLAKYYSGCADVTVNGVYDKHTCSAIMDIRRKTGMGDSDIVDIRAWNVIVGEYNLVVNENE